MAKKILDPARNRGSGSAAEDSRLCRRTSDTSGTTATPGDYSAVTHSVRRGIQPFRESETRGASAVADMSRLPGGEFEHQ